MTTSVRRIVTDYEHEVAYSHNGHEGTVTANVAMILPSIWGMAPDDPMYQELRDAAAPPEQCRKRCGRNAGDGSEFCSVHEPDPLNRSAL